jgi:hypothetical protein
LTTKQQVDLGTYKKRPRLLTESMEHALCPAGGLHPLLAAVTQDGRLRMDIRERRFNIYYAGGSLLSVDARRSPWAMHFDEKYFKGGSLEPPALPGHYSTADDSRAWVETFPTLIHAMEDWWERYPKVERAHCQAMAAANDAGTGLPTSDYLVLDLEYQWAQRRFDMIAAKRSPTKDDPAGWVEPDLVFVEVKSDYGACKGRSGLGDHARDYRDNIKAGGGTRVPDIKLEYENMIAQKRRLGLIADTLPFGRFSAAVPELLFVLVDLDPEAPPMAAPLAEVGEVANELGEAGHIRFMRLASPKYRMTAAAARPSAIDKAS